MNTALLDYLNPKQTDSIHCVSSSKKAFINQKQNMASLCKALRPKAVACLGAGFLNDIPLPSFIASDATVYLVDWMAEVCEKGLNREIVNHIDSFFSCLVCQYSHSPHKYCTNYRDWSPEELEAFDEKPEYCAGFVPSPESHPHCRNFKAGEMIALLRQDVTQGKATSFADHVSSILENTQRPRESFKSAIKLADAHHTPLLLPIEEKSIDLVTSSMVASQFDFEPFTYFLKKIQASDRRLIAQDIEILGRLEIELRDKLFAAQLEGHCQEILRIMKPDGRLYFSMETLHKSNEDDPWFQPEIVPKVMEILGQHFYFDVALENELIIRDQITTPTNGQSCIQAHVMVPRLH